MQGPRAACLRREGPAPGGGVQFAHGAFLERSGQVQHRRQGRAPRLAGGIHRGPYLAFVGDVGAGVADVAQLAQTGQALGLGFRCATGDQQPGAGGAQQMGGDLGADAAQAAGEQGEAVACGRLGTGRGVGQGGEAAYVTVSVAVRHLRAVHGDRRLGRQQGRRVRAVVRREVEVGAAQPSELLGQRLEQRARHGVGRGRAVAGAYGLGARRHVHEVDRASPARSGREGTGEGEQFPRIGRVLRRRLRITAVAQPVEVQD